MPVKYLQQEIIGTPFLNQIMPIQKIDQNDIKCFYQNQNMVFEFIQDPETSILNEFQQILVSKEKIFNFLKIEVIFNGYSSKASNFKNKIKKF